MALFDLHHNVIADFLGSLVSDWNVSLNTWNMTRDSEDTGRREDMTKRDRKSQTPRRPEKREKVDFYMMALDTINLEEVGNDEGLYTYEKVWESSDLAHSINMPHFFWVGLLLEAVSRKQEKAVEILRTLCGDVLVDQIWVEESIHSRNLQLADIAVQGVSNFTEWR